MPWSNLGFYLKPRTGNVMAVAAASGVGKSLLALAWTERLEVPCIYISLDQTLVDQAVRLLAMRKRLTVDQIMEGHEEDKEMWADRWSKELMVLNLPLRFSDVAGTYMDAYGIVAAETEYWGRPPLITVIDNVANLLEAEESAAEYHSVFAGMNKIAKDHDTMVMALHHLRRKPPGKGQAEYDQGTKPVMKTDILYAGDREVQYLLGMWRPRNDMVKVSVLKNRMGPADPSSNLNATLKVDFPKATVYEDQLTEYRESIDQNRRDRRWEEE